MNHRKAITAATAIALAIPLIVCASTTVASAQVKAVSDPASLPIEGYLMAASGASSFVQRDAAALGLVGVDGVNVKSNGHALTATPADAAPIVTATHAHGLKAELLVGNYDDAIGDFSPAIATKLLSSSSNRAAVISSLVSKVSAGGYDGVQLDMESLDSSHGPGLSAFASELRAALPAGKTISMAVMASETVSGYAAEGYQLGTLAGSVGRFVLMAYDQHGPWSSAGPVGGTPWVNSVLTAFINTGVPKSQIDLGVGEYGYTWPGDGSTGVQLSDANARAQAGAAAHFVAAQGEWTATLADGTVIWWSDGQTFAERKALAAQYGVHGLAIWELSLGDPVS